MWCASRRPPLGVRLFLSLLFARRTRHHCRGRNPRAQLENRAFLVRDQSAKDHFGLGTASDRLGTDRHRSRQRTATIGVFGFATVQGVRHALAGIERAT